MIKYISVLIEKGFAYNSGGDVYFNVRKFTEYGLLSGQGIDSMLKGVRIEASDLKKDPLDFALWKKSKEGEPFWPSPWGNGRPGWHIECSVMSQKFLKTDTLDIHAGGRDLIFPHHENEIAQAEALTGKPFAKYWIHHGLLTINGQKMSKSLGNFVTIKDFITKYHNPDLLKLLFLFAHYSSPVDFNEEKIEEAKAALQRIMILKEKIDKKVEKSQGRNVPSNKIKEIEKIKGDFVKAMDDDFNTPQALAAVFELVTISNKNIDSLDFSIESKAALEEFFEILGILKSKSSKGILGLLVDILKDENASESGGITEKQIIDKIKKRNAARENKDFLLSDKIRKELEVAGVILEDTKEGTTWRRRL
jgi:cysteinyl-tRNA synthetase